MNERLSSDGPYVDFVRYLESKQSVDDRALNGRVWEAMATDLRARKAPVRILEVGAGHGAMVERLASAKLLSTAEYTALDQDATSIEAARQRFRGDRRLGSLELVDADLFSFAESGASRADLIIAHAVLDLLDLRRVLSALRALSAPGGAFYFTINFDGETIFEPSVDPALDAEIVALYHATMDERTIDGCRSGSSRTGRLLFEALRITGADIHAAGSSDWVVWPIDGEYPKDEAFFLHFIVATVGRALSGAPDIAPPRLQAWLDARHAQIARGELVYIAHQLDFFGRWG